MEEKNTLRLSIKKELYIDVTENQVRQLSFEIKPYWMSRFTGDSKNKIEDVKSGVVSFKSYDEVLISCNDQSTTFKFVGVEIVDDEFVVRFDDFTLPVTDLDELGYSFDNGDVLVPEVETLKEEELPEPKMEYIEPVKEEVEEEIETPAFVSFSEPKLVKTELYVDEVVEELLYSKYNVFCVNGPVVNISSNGRIMGCDRRLPIRNDAGGKFFLNTITITSPVGDVENLKNQLNKITSNKHVFVWKEKTNWKVENDEVKISFRLCMVNKTIE